MVQIEFRDHYDCSGPLLDEIAYAGEPYYGSSGSEDCDIMDNCANLEGDYCFTDNHYGTIHDQYIIFSDSEAMKISNDNMQTEELTCYNDNWDETCYCELVYSNVLEVNIEVGEYEAGYLFDSDDLENIPDSWPVEDYLLTNTFIELEYFQEHEYESGYLNYYHYYEGALQYSDSHDYYGCLDACPSDGHSMPDLNAHCGFEFFKIKNWNSTSLKLDRPYIHTDFDDEWVDGSDHCRRYIFERVDNIDSTIPGCTDPTSNNYNPYANQDNGTCHLDECGDGRFSSSQNNNSNEQPNYRNNFNSLNSLLGK